jgi:hypothetical protein
MMTARPYMCVRNRIKIPASFLTQNDLTDSACDRVTSVQARGFPIEAVSGSLNATHFLNKFGSGKKLFLSSHVLAGVIAAVEVRPQRSFPPKTAPLARKALTDNNSGGYDSDGNGHQTYY